MRPGTQFSDPAVLYDLIYQFKDYEGEAATLAAWLREFDVTTVLEGACGTGTYLQHLAGFSLAGFDLDPAMVAQARQRVGQAKLWTADLCSFEVAEPYDAVLLLFGGIGYAPPDRLGDAVRALHAAVKPGGVVVVEPFHPLDGFEANRPQMAVVDTPFLKICRQVVPTLEGRKATLDFHFLVSRPGFEVEHIVDGNTLWLHDHDEVEGLLTDVGFEVERRPGFMSHGTLFFGRRV